LRAQYGAALPAGRAVGRASRVAAPVALDAVGLLPRGGLVPPRARAAAHALGVRRAARERDLLPRAARRGERSVREAAARPRRLRRRGPEPAAPAARDDD